MRHVQWSLWPCPTPIWDGRSGARADVRRHAFNHAGAPVPSPGSTSRPSQGPLAVAGAYLAHGIEHILFGFDHLLFVLGLILIVSSTRMLLLTVTGFTVAHSITLSLATLGVLHIPAPPVEACIALSILLLASEIACGDRGGRQV